MQTNIKVRAMSRVNVIAMEGVMGQIDRSPTDYIMPPRIAPTRARGIMNLAERAVRALDCTGAVRVDVLVTEGENEYVLEVNTLPGMTPTSLLPKIAEHAGLDYGALCEVILDGARLHAKLERSPSERPRSGVMFKGRDLSLVKTGS